MNARRTAVLVLVILLGGAAAGTWRSAQPARPANPAHRLAAELRCPACQGESVADSRSPIAAAMRDVISDQLARGRTTEEVRGYLVQRYGPDVLAAPPARGLGLLLWLAPALALLAGLAPAVRAVRRSRRLHSTPRPGRRSVVSTRHRRDAGRDGRRSGGKAGRPGWRGRHPGSDGRRPGLPAMGNRIWNISAACLLGLVGGVALATPHLPAEPGPSAAVDPVPGQLALARSMEQQGRYGAAANIYRSVLRQQPADNIRLRLAFTLIRSDQPAEAGKLARQVLASQPDAPDALLLLGLAQRNADPAASAATLRRFLTRQPDHPAAAEVRRLLGSG